MVLTRSKQLKNKKERQKGLLRCRSLLDASSCLPRAETKEERASKQNKNQKVEHRRLLLNKQPHHTLHKHTMFCETLYQTGCANFYSSERFLSRVNLERLSGMAVQTREKIHLRNTPMVVRQPKETMSKRKENSMPTYNQVRTAFEKSPPPSNCCVLSSA